MSIRVVVADDQTLVRAGFRLLVDSAPDLEVVGEAVDGAQALELARQQRPDVVLMDIRMPTMDGLEATRQISADTLLADVRVLILTTFDLDEYVYQALRVGASGFLLKDTPPADLLAAIRVVAAGDALLAPGITRRLIAEFARRPDPAQVTPAALEALTDREREVLALVARGLSNSEIAQRLVVSAATSKTYVSRLLTKLGARDRAQLVAIAYERPGHARRWLSPPRRRRRLPNCRSWPLPTDCDPPGVDIEAWRPPDGGHGTVGWGPTTPATPVRTVAWKATNRSGRATMGQLTEGLLLLSGWAALALLFMLPALEAPAFLGLVLPGELALLLGGVLAHQDRIPLAGALAVGVAGAVAGDSAGYWIGRRWGPRLLTSRLGRRVGPARLHKVEALLLRGGGWALVVGRCTAGARVVLPGLAGMLGLRYRTFVLWTGAAATVWAAAHVLLGYAAGAGWRHIHHLTSRVGLLLAGAVLVALAVAWLLHRPAKHDEEPHQPIAAGQRHD
jgi:DNA-binding NarL/FixJ family response regulator/membrane protein DedA with SNARE-associated domain